MQEEPVWKDLDSIALQLAKGPPYGTVNVEFKRANNKVVGSVRAINKQSKYQKGHNTEATAAILQQIKQAITDKLSGTISFSVTFKDGDISLINHNNYNQTTY